MIENYIFKDKKNGALLPRFNPIEMRVID